MKIPFHPNTADGIHCWQAALKMVLGFFEPDLEFSYSELDRITGHVAGKWTWPTKGMLWLIERGYEVRVVEDFDYNALATQGADYLLRRFGEELGRAQIEKSDVDAELAFAEEFSRRGSIEVRLPSLPEIEELIADGSVVICNINPRTLYHEAGYSSHFVVLCSIEGDEIILHDPGLPPKPSYRTTKKDFNRAWAYPTKRERNLLAIRRFP